MAEGLDKERKPLFLYFIGGLRVITNRELGGKTADALLEGLGPPAAENADGTVTVFFGGPDSTGSGGEAFQSTGGWHEIAAATKTPARIREDGKLVWINRRSLSYT